jgi:type II secretory pathway component GspD/PulD (secretin)
MTRALVLVVLASLAAGCGASRAYGHADHAARVGDWDTAVEYYRRAVQSKPQRSDYKIALQRAMINASNVHTDQARVFEARGQLDEALREYQRAAQYDPVSRALNAKVDELQKRIRQQLESAQAKPTITQLRERARQASGIPILNPASREPLTLSFGPNASLRDILNFIGKSAGINVTFERDFQDRSFSIQLDNVSLEDALNQILTANQDFYKVLNDRTIQIIPDTTQKRAQYEEQVIRTFFVSHADATELAQLLNTVVRTAAMPIQPRIVANKTANTITVGASKAVVDIIEKVIESNDTPRAEVVIDVQILEVNKARAKQYGLDLGTYAIGGIFSPEINPLATTTSSGTTSTGSSSSATSTTTLTSQPFNLNTISRGVNTGDFYLTVPSAVVRFLETDTDTKLIAKPQLRGAEGQKITLNLGDEVPIPTTVFTPLATGGSNVNPLTSFTYKTVGIVVTMTPRVTYEDDIVLEMTLEASSLGNPVIIAGQSLPSFNTRKVETKIRLRDGESNLLAGLLQENEMKALTGFPGILRLPIFSSLFSSNNTQVTQTDIVMLLTPRLVRTHELTQQALNPIYIGSQQNLGLNGPPPLIAPPEPAPGAPVGQPPAGAPPTGVPPTGTGVVPVVPPGSTAQPGTTGVPAGTPAVPPTPSQAATTAPPAQIVLTPPSPDFLMGGGPYIVPISVSNGSRLSTVSVTVTYNPSVLRVRTVQEGSFMRQGGVSAQFTQQVDPTTGRIDIAIARTSDGTGASGVGLLAAVLFDPVVPGPANIAVSGTATAPDGSPLPLQFPAVAISVK